MKLYDKIRLAAREGKKSLIYLVITSLLFAIVSSVSSSLLLTAVNLRRDYIAYLDKSAGGRHEFSVSCLNVGASTEELSACGFDKVEYYMSFSEKVGIVSVKNGEKLKNIQSVPFVSIKALLSPDGSFEYELVSGEDIAACFDTPQSDCMWFNEAAALSGGIAVGDRVQIKYGARLIKEYTVAGIYRAEFFALDYPVIIPINSYFDCAVSNNADIESLFSCTLSSLSEFDRVISAAEQMGCEVNTGNIEISLSAMDYVYILLAGLALLFAMIAFFSVSNTFSVTIAKGSHTMTLFSLLGARKSSIYAVYFFPYLLSILSGAVIGCAVLLQLFSYISSLTEELLSFTVMLEAEKGLILISLLSILFILVLSVMLYGKFRWLTRKSLSEAVRECDT